MYFSYRQIFHKPLPSLHKRKVQRKEIGAPEEAIPTKQAIEVIDLSKFYERKSPEELSPEVESPEELSRKVEFPN